MIKDKDLKLSNGNLIPMLSLGTWLMSEEEARKSVKEALLMGYRHIDTAQAYANEKAVGEGVRDSGLNRSEVYITSKVAAEIKTYKEAKKSIEESLKRLNLGYIDLMLIHSPQPWQEFGAPYRYEKENKEVWRALMEAYKAGKVRAIGVSNFNIGDLKNLETEEIKPMVNQIPCYVGNTPFELIDYCKKEGVVVEAYSPIAHGSILKNEKMQEIAAKYNVSVSQICLKYCALLDLVIIPKTTNLLHMKEDMELEFEIEKDDLEILKNFEYIRAH